VIEARRALEAGWFDEQPAATPLGEGHINDTLLVTAPSQRFVLQRINRAVFRDPSVVTENLDRIRAHLRTRAPGLIPELVLTRDGASAHVDKTGNWWRLWRFVEGARSMSATTDPAIAAAAGAAFGRFQKLLSDLEEPPLPPTIPGFLELPAYLAEFDKVAGSDPDTAVDLAFIDTQRPLAEKYLQVTGYIHGDCKLNNLLFHSERPEVVSVLDLDTVMLGHWAWDFGDLVRSLFMGTTFMGATDRSDLERLAALFEAVVRGFVSESEQSPGVAELVVAPRYVAFMLGVRFLTDHLRGDVYFKVNGPGENLQRANEQFDLVRRLASAENDLERVCVDTLNDLPDSARR